MNTFKIYEELKPSLGHQAAGVLADVLGRLLDERDNTVTKDDFHRLETTVDNHVSRLDNALANLAEAQRKTEQRLDSLAIKVEELAQAQKRTEIKVEELAQAQKRTEIKVEQLAEAQLKTELTIREMRSEIGSIQRNFSYSFENDAYRLLPPLIEKRFGLCFIFLDILANRDLFISRDSPESL
jgi:DNA repair ATPase RecN